MNTEIDDMMIDELRDGFAPVGYERTTGSFRPPSRTPYVAGVAVIAAVAATVVVVGGDGARSPALAWSPTPTAATAADESAARTACAAPDGARGVVSVQGVAAVTPSDGSTPMPELGSGEPIEVTVDASSGEVVTGGAVSGATGAKPLTPGEALPGVPSMEAPPTELPPLVSLDLRGTGGLAVFADDQWTFTCMLLQSDDGFETGPIMASPTAELPKADELAVVAGMQTSWADGRSLAMVSGTAPAGATSVELSLPGQPTASAEVEDGRFSIWWFGSFDPSAGTIRALDASGAELTTLSPMIDKR